MSASSRFRWFRISFSLRTLFVMMALAGCWLGYNLNWIRQRHEFLAEQAACYPRESMPRVDCVVETPRVSAPGALWMFGERGHYWFFLVARDQPDTEQIKLRAARLFPEATIQEDVRLISDL